MTRGLLVSGFIGNFLNAGSACFSFVISLVRFQYAFRSVEGGPSSPTFGAGRQTGSGCPPTTAQERRPPNPRRHNGGHSRCPPRRKEAIHRCSLTGTPEIHDNLYLFGEAEARELQLSTSTLLLGIRLSRVSTSAAICSRRITHHIKCPQYHQNNHTLHLQTHALLDRRCSSLLLRRR